MEMDSDMSKDTFKPAKIDEKKIAIGGRPLDIKRIGCFSSVDEIIANWVQLDKNGFPIRSLTALFVGRESVRGQNERIIEYEIPLVHHIVRLLDGIIRCRSITGANKRINDIKRKYSTLVNRAAKTPLPEQRQIQDQLIEDIIQAGDELQLASILNDICPSLEFTAEKAGGADFRIDELTIKIEAKSKLDRRFVDNYPIPEDIDANVCKRLLAREAFKAGLLEKAFDKQQTDIAAFDLRHSEYGIIFAGFAYQTGSALYAIEEAFKEAVRLHNDGKLAVILYSEIVTFDGCYEIVALVCDKETVERKGSELEKVEKTSRLNALDPEKKFFAIIEAATRLERA